jgi:hypothetical protein
MDGKFFITYFSLKYSKGFKGVKYLRISKCKCAPVTEPVMPLFAIS